MKNRWNPENILREGVAFPTESTTCTKYECCFGEILTKHIYIKKGFLCVVNLFNEARNTVSNSGKGSFSSIEQRFSRVYLLRISKGQLGPRDIDLNNNNIGRRLTCQGFCNKIYITLIYKILSLFGLKLFLTIIIARFINQSIDLYIRCYIKTTYNLPFGSFHVNNILLL